MPAHGLDSIVHGVPIRDVGRDGHGTNPDFIGHARRSVGPDVENGHFRTLGRKQFCNTLAKATASSGHNCNFAFKCAFEICRTTIALHAISSLKQCSEGASPKTQLQRQ